MESKNYADKITDFIIELDQENNVRIDEGGPPQPINEETVSAAYKLGFSKSFVTIYIESAEFFIRWFEKTPTDPNVFGNVALLPLEQIIKSTEGNIYFKKHIDDDDPIQDFHIVDNFVNEACVGIFAGKNATNSLYYLYYGEDPIYLGLDFAGYIEMLIAAKCYRYWQKAILEIRQKKENAASIEFKKHMPRLFPGWTWEEFVAKYESLKIEENAF